MHIVVAFLNVFEWNLTGLLELLRVRNSQEFDWVMINSKMLMVHSKVLMVQCMVNIMHLFSVLTTSVFTIDTITISILFPYSLM